MSRYFEILQEVEECMCTECFGTGEIIEINNQEEICPCCEGSGINPEMAISFDIERTK